MVSYFNYGWNVGPFLAVIRILNVDAERSKKTCKSLINSHYHCVALAKETF